MRGKVLCLTEDPDRPTTAMFIGLREAGFDLAVICPGYEQVITFLRDNRVRVLDVTIPRRFDRHGTGELRRIIVDGNYQILHLFSNSALESGLRASRGLDTRIVAYRGIVGNVSFLNPISWRRFLNPRIDRIVCVADCVREYFLSMRPAWLRLPPERSVTIYKGHDLDWYQAEPAQLHHLGMPDNAFVVSCAANYRPRKGIEVLVAAMSHLPAEWNAHLILVGRMDAKRLRKEVEQSPASSRIHFLGHRDDAPAVIAASDVFVLPSIRREGLSRSLIEAMAYGIPPVATDCGGNAEIVIDGACGLLVPTGSPSSIADAIGQLYRDDALRERLGQAARLRIENGFRIEDTISRTAVLYDSLLAG
jgi:glycosyltransferase involved in cell wall biosynthesis